MRYRRLSEYGDYEFGTPGNIMADTPEAVAQAVRTRLALWSGEWFLDLREGTAYMTDILGTGTSTTRDIEVRDRIRNTPGVVDLESYESSVNEHRQFIVTARVRTAYGIQELTTEI